MKEVSRESGDHGLMIAVDDEFIYDDDESWDECWSGDEEKWRKCQWAVGFVEKKKEKIKGGGLRWVMVKSGDECFFFFYGLMIKGFGLKSSWPIFIFNIISSFSHKLPKLFIALEWGVLNNFSHDPFNLKIGYFQVVINLPMLVLFPIWASGFPSMVLTPIFFLLS